MTDAPHYLFVYGTLMQDAENPMAQLLHDHAAYVGPATFTGGRLYRISWYPGLVETGAQNEIVHGDLYRFDTNLSPETLSDIMTKLDAYEMIGPDFTPPYEYSRETRAVTCGGTDIDAWLYLYQWSVEKAEYLPSNRFSNR